MAKLFYSIISVFFIIIIALFAVSNQDVVKLSIFPFSKNYSMPVYAVVLLSVFFGFLWGVLVSSLNILKLSLKHSKEKRDLKKHIN